MKITNQIVILNCGTFMAASATSLDTSTPRGHLHEKQRPHYVVLASQPTTTSAHYQPGVWTMADVTGELA